MAQDCVEFDVSIKDKCQGVNSVRSTAQKPNSDKAIVYSVGQTKRIPVE